MNLKVRASEKKNKLFEEIFKADGENLFKELIKRGMEKLLQESLEEEVTEFLGREWYQRDEQPGTRGYRNGYYDRKVKTSEGIFELKQPRVRNTEEDFESRILKGIAHLEENLKELAGAMYLRGMSTRDIEQTFTDEEGHTYLSRSSVSRINEKLYEEYKNFSKRDLSELDVVYMFTDGVYEAVRKYTNNQALLCAWGICSDGTKQLIHISAVESESLQAWEGFFEDLLARGLRQPLLVVSDGAKGANSAIARSFPKTDRQRCLAHKLRNITAKLPRDKQREILPQIKEVYYAADYEKAKVLAANFTDKFIDEYPSAVKCFNDDIEACLVHLKYPLGHRQFIRTTNLLERAFEEEKRRTKVFPQHSNEKALLGLVFSVLHNASLNWRKIAMKDSELKLLKNIRKLICPNDHNEDFISYKLVA